MPKKSASVVKESGCSSRELSPESSSTAPVAVLGVSGDSGRETGSMTTCGGLWIFFEGVCAKVAVHIPGR